MVADVWLGCIKLVLGAVTIVVLFASCSVNFIVNATDDVGDLLLGIVLTFIAPSLLLLVAPFFFFHMQVPPPSLQHLSWGFVGGGGGGLYRECVSAPGTRQGTRVFTSGGGGGGRSSPPKLGGGVGKRAQLTGPLIIYYALGRRNFF